MKLRPGRNLMRCLVATLIGSLTVFVVPQIVYLGLLLAVAIAVLVGIDIQFLRTQRKAFEVNRIVPTVVGRGERFRVTWQLRRASEEIDSQASGAASAPRFSAAIVTTGGLTPPRSPGISQPWSVRATLRGEWRDEVPTVAEPRFVSGSFELFPNQLDTELAREFCVPIRGQYRFGPFWLRLSGPCGFVEGQWSLPTTNDVKVLPETYCSHHDLAKDAAAELKLLDKMVRTRQQGIGTDFQSLSEFREGDDPRRIDWRSSARQRRLIVRKYQVERHRDVMIVIDCGRLMAADAAKGNKLDCAIDAGLMMARVALQYGDRCGLALFDDQVLGYLPPVSGLPSLRAIVDQVYATQSRWRESDFGRMFATLQQRQQKRSLMIVISDIVDVQTTERFRASLGKLARRHAVLFAALQTPLLGEVVQTPVERVLDGSRMAVAFRLLREREQALHTLRHADVHVLDVTPSQLTIPLINQFLELRQRVLI